MTNALTLAQFIAAQPLKDVREERFAQLVAAGQHCETAYHECGWLGDKGNAMQMAIRSRVRDRIESLRQVRIEIQAEAALETAKKLKIDEEWIVSRLAENAQIAMGEKPVKMRIVQKQSGDVIEVEVTQREGAVANQALTLLGKNIGMWTEKLEIRAGGLDDLDDRQRQNLRIAVEQELASRAGGADPA